MTDNFLDQAETAILKLLKQQRPTLLDAYGKVSFETKYDQTVVTQLDRQVEEELRELLKTIDPAIGIEGEEYGIEGNRETYWLVDPIDGTEQFVRGIPACKNLLCLIENGEPVWSLMYYFVTDELYLARKGQGVTYNDKKITMTHRPLNRAWIEIVFNIMQPEHIKILKRLRPGIGNFCRARDTAMLVTGTIDGIVAINADGGPWDYAPRELMYREAGGKIANIGVDTYDFHDNSFMMAHAKNFDQLMKLVTGDA